MIGYVLNKISFFIQVQNCALMITNTSWYDQPLQACPGVPIFEGYVESWEKKN